MEDPAVSLETFGDDGSRVLVERVQPRANPTGGTRIAWPTNAFVPHHKSIVTQMRPTEPVVRDTSDSACGLVGLTPQPRR